jgi:uncharacterized protein YkwD
MSCTQSPEHAIRPETCRSWHHGLRPKRLVSLTLLVCVIVTATSCRHHRSAATPYGGGLPSVSATPDASALERRMFQLLNRDRAKAGLPPLAYDERLADIARYHSRDMKQGGYFGHDSPTSGSPQDRIDASGYLAAESRENVALAPDAELAQQQLMVSPGHHANIMATTTTHVGIGAFKADPQPGIVDNYYFTQLFARPVRMEAPTEARTRVVAAIADARRRSGLPPVRQHQVLEQYAQEYVSQLDAGNADRSLAGIGDAVAERLTKEGGHGLSSVVASAQIGVSSTEFQVPPGVMTRQVRAIGVAADRGTDPSGRPIMKVLLLMGW